MAYVRSLCFPYEDIFLTALGVRKDGFSICIYSQDEKCDVSVTLTYLDVCVYILGGF